MSRKEVGGVILAEVVKSERCEENANNFQLPMRGPVARIAVTACQSQLLCLFHRQREWGSEKLSILF